MCTDDRPSVRDVAEHVLQQPEQRLTVREIRQWFQQPALQGLAFPRKRLKAGERISQGAGCVVGQVPQQCRDLLQKYLRVHLR
ncbi:hypothetical protein [Streptomyces sp. NPDC096339]|uniref:hypothetical protein n=1 Tax=Streptomyces sp. NPDC096339 TaxID=3366086 RepID=UPI0038036283